ncbi:hypothetical protein JOQ06_006645 [Pogonophryne albipinna]|uniref:Uncharacterized protein n=1 Tax=Pogonophryne albipinna TaxID=1090488 RepID=A0AAD6FH93_9TELE|nr:hypothetical protein JOQ06_006645 [Pogonophryne albipinna]
MVRLLSPLKKAMSDESQPTVSLIVPLKHMIEQSMAQCDEDSSTIAHMKRAILKDFTDRYQGEQNKFLQESTALDPRFQSLHQLNDSQREEVFDRLKLKATQIQNQNPSETEGERAAVPHTAHDADKEQSPPSKKTALEDLLGESFSKEVPCTQLNADSMNGDGQGVYCMEIHGTKTSIPVLSTTCVRVQHHMLST